MYRKILGRTPSEQMRAKRAPPTWPKNVFFEPSGRDAPREARNHDNSTPRKRSRETYPSMYARCNSSDTEQGSPSLSETYLIHPRLAAPVPLPLWGRLTLARDQTKRLPPGGFAVIPSPTEGKVAARSFDRADG